jgi:hypothetical protein
VLASPAGIALCLAPFAFIALVPANGRYAYVAIVGIVLAVCAIAASIATRWPRAGIVVIAAGLVAIGIDWLPALRTTVNAYQRASVLVAAVRADTIGVAAEHTGSGNLLLIEDPPDFVKGERHEPVAKVLQYGLSESVTPPFGPLERSPIPLGTSIRFAARAALGALPAVASYRWDAHAARLMPVGQRSPPDPTLALGPFDAANGRLEAECDDCASTRLFLLTPSLPFVVAPEQAIGGHARFAVSRDLLDGLAGLGDGPAFFWVEESDGDATTAISPIARFELGDAARSFAEAADPAAKMRRR